MNTLLSNHNSETCLFSTNTNVLLDKKLPFWLCLCSNILLFDKFVDSKILANPSEAGLASSETGRGRAFADKHHMCVDNLCTCACDCDFVPKRCVRRSQLSLRLVENKLLLRPTFQIRSKHPRKIRGISTSWLPGTLGRFFL